MEEKIVSGALICLDCADKDKETVIAGDIFFGGYKPVILQSLEIATRIHHEEQDTLLRGIHTVTLASFYKFLFEIQLFR